MFEFSNYFHQVYNVFLLASYILGIIGASLILYTFLIMSVIALTIVRLKTANPFKIIHIMSVVEVYAFICLLIGIILTSKIYGLLLFKIILFGIIVVFNGVTATRLIAKTAYFYSMRGGKSNSKEAPK